MNNKGPKILLCSIQRRTANQLEKVLLILTGNVLALKDLIHSVTLLLTLNDCNFCNSR